MSFRFKPLKSWSLRAKILLIFLLLISIPLSLQGVATYVDFSSSIERRTSDYTAQLVDQINRNLDRTLMEMQRLTLMPVYDSGVLSILRKYRGEDSLHQQPTVEERSKMQLYIASMTFDRPEIDSIQIFAGNGYTFSSLAPSAIAAYTDVERQPWYSRVEEARGAWVLLPPHRPSYYLDGNQSYFSVARLIREPNTNRTLGLVKIDLKQTLFKQLVDNARMEENGGIVVQNSREELFYTAPAEKDTETSKLLPDRIRELSGRSETASQLLNMEGNEYLVVSNYSKYSDINIVSYIPVASLLVETKELRNFTLLAGMVCLALAGAFATYFSYRLTKPLGTLVRKMRLVELGDFKQSVPAVTEDEIGRLGSGFNRMVEEIDRLVHEVYVLGMREKEAELAALQSQIHPHFIYNTLESISMLARQHGNEDVSEMTTALGRLIRSAVEQDQSLIRLGEELETAESYIHIQKMRHGSRLRAMFDIEEGLEDCLVPKLLLQPLIENAIMHGIGDREQGGTVYVTAARFEGVVLLTVSDDGRGMSEEELAALWGSLEEAGATAAAKMPATPLHGHGVALKNIKQRLLLIYGSDCDFEIDGSLGQGTAFTITLPFVAQKEQEVGIG
ncbi:sensor histidine kinase [Paenibacillus sp. FSL R5-0527]|uniref:cache domain-containing sensor histidine kinase n=1 Tax=Paenibacillus TaxID=44249 RepID=UPI00097B4D77|nr:sensor histidine kinase [Paenibacillus macerans]MED4955918.1 sensor histidine kinase [Paenibacillus macerans]OMG47574.1 two-component sensor histidine kinase [Paenibacillus macerans]